MAGLLSSHSNDRFESLLFSCWKIALFRQTNAASSMLCVACTLYLSVSSKLLTMYIIVRGDVSSHDMCCLSFALRLSTQWGHSETKKPDHQVFSSVLPPPPPPLFLARQMRIWYCNRAAYLGGLLAVLWICKNKMHFFKSRHVFHIHLIYML